MNYIWAIFGKAKSHKFKLEGSEIILIDIFHKILHIL